MRLGAGFLLFGVVAHASGLYGVSYSIGPYNSRFGAWARSIPDGHTAELQLDSDFAAGVNSVSGVTMAITYLDNVANASFTTTFGAQSVTTALNNSGAWQTVTIPVNSQLLPDASGGHIAIQATGAAITFHMVDLEKPGLLQFDMRYGIQ